MLHLRRPCRICWSRSLSQSHLFNSKYGAFVNGAETFPDSGKPANFFSVEAPATTEHLCDVLDTSQELLDRAVNIAEDKFQSGVWSRADVRQRAQVLSKISVLLSKRIPDLLQLEVAQTGRAIREMRAQVSYYY